MGNVAGTDWEMPIMLAAMYGLRISEALGLRWTNVDMEEGTFAVVEQLPHKIPAGMTVITEMAPVKGKGADGSGERVLPITEAARPYFQRQLDLQARQKSLAASSGTVYYDNQLVIANPNGSPRRRDRVSADFGQLIRRLETPHIRFHDLRHTFATHALASGVDVKTLSGILGHTRAAFTLDTYTHVTGDMQKRAANIVGDFMTDIFGEELEPWAENEKTGTFASAASGGCSEQKGVAAAPLAGRREAGTGMAMRQQEKDE
ncbi:MAG: site-specific integrase [Clostridia bacterium]|nr:site-specific integrase [Clostridia bacterium]